MFPNIPGDHHSYVRRQLSGKIKPMEGCTVDMTGFKVRLYHVFFLRTVEGLRELTTDDRVILDLSSGNSFAGTTIVKDDDVRRDNTFSFSWKELKVLPCIKANAYVKLHGTTFATYGTVHRFYKIEGLVHDTEDGIWLSLFAPLVSYTNEVSVDLGIVEGVCIDFLGIGG